MLENAIVSAPAIAIARGRAVRVRGRAPVGAVAAMKPGTSRARPQPLRPPPPNGWSSGVSPAGVIESPGIRIGSLPRRVGNPCTVATARVGPPTTSRSATPTVTRPATTSTTPSATSSAVAMHTDQGMPRRVEPLRNDPPRARVQQAREQVRPRRGADPAGVHAGRVGGGTAPPAMRDRPAAEAAVRAGARELHHAARRAGALDDEPARDVRV